MKLLDLLQENSGDLKRKRDLFVTKWKQVMRPKSRKAKIDYVEKVLDDILTKDEKRFLVLQLQKNR